MRIISFSAVALALAACAPSGHPPGRSGGEPSTLGATRGSPSPQRPAAPPARSHSVTLTIEGTVRRTSVTYTPPGGRTEHRVIAPPWSRTFTAADGQSFELTAHSDADGSLGCRLTVDGEVLKSAMSSGDSMTVDCGDIVG